MRNDIEDLVVAYRAKMAEAANEIVRSDQTDHLMVACARLIALTASFSVLSMLSECGATLTIPESKKVLFGLSRDGDKSE